MKKYIIIITSIIFITTACNKKLDVLPQNSITPEQIKTSADVEALLFGSYEQMQGYGAFGEQYILMPDLLASDSQVNFIGTYTDYQAVQHQSIVSTNSVASSMWTSGYSIINIVNTVLDKLSVVDTADQSTVEGEAKFIRALIYFQLVQMYAKPYSDGNASSNLGVPIVLLPTYAYDSTKNKPARAKVTDVYTQIVADLQTAIAKLPSTNENFRADLYSAKAILARVYMSMLDYQDAATQADDIINSGNFSLTPSYSGAFNNLSNSSEDIFAIQQSTQSNAGTSNDGLTTFYAPQTAGRGDAQIDPLYFSFFDDPNDFRGNFFTAGYSIAGYQGDYPNKWALFYKAISVVRLAEMYLTRGEANLLTGASPTGTPLTDINIVRGRSGAGPLGTVTDNDFVNERMRELGFEGDRFRTLKRLQLDINGLSYDDDKMIFPIPQSEIDVNKNLVQNAGY